MAARFFCDNCGTEVKRDSSRCPRCGRFFAFVRCPQCDYIGEEQKFAQGCPVCGYCAAKQGDASFTLSNKPSKLPLLAAGNLPLWVYIIALLGLALVALALYFAIR